MHDTNYRRCSSQLHPTYHPENISILLLPYYLGAKVKSQQGMSSSSVLKQSLLPDMFY